MRDDDVELLVWDNLDIWARKTNQLLEKKTKKQKTKSNKPFYFHSLGRILYEEYYEGFPAYCYFKANVIYVGSIIP